MSVEQGGQAVKLTEREVRAMSERMGLGALARAENRRKRHGIDAGTYWPTAMLAIGIDELELLVHELGRRRPLLAAPRDPALEPFVDELELVLRTAKAGQS